MPAWNTDAQFATSIDNSYLHANRKIAGFLEPGSYNQFILVASKGMGKTLLMRHKRKILEDEKRGFVLIPRNNTADYVQLPSSPPKDLLASFEDRLFWEDLWKIAISVSALLNFPHNLGEEEIEVAMSEFERVYLPAPLPEELGRSFHKKYKLNRTPSSVLNILLGGGKSKLERTRSSGVQVLWDAYNRYITSGCFIFIDSFDQALSEHFSDNLDIWCSAQTGLMKAAWELSRHNRHSKVLTTIRQEAYASFADSERINLKGNVLVIEYSQADLEKIFKNAVLYYEDVKSIEEFVGFEKMYNSYLKTHEKVFDYIVRHTIGVPRWLIAIGSEISAARSERGLIRDARRRAMHQKTIADVVNQVSAVDLARVYLEGEMRLFFQGDDPVLFIDRLLSNINSSVLSYSNIERISRRFVEEHDWTSTAHPFCLLYNFGLIGVVADTATATRKTQLFQKPYQFNWSFEHILPVNPSGYYLLHPSLHHLIQRKNYRFNFNKVRIGDGLTWGKKETKRIESEILKVFISYAHADWETVKTVLERMEEYLNMKAILHDIWLDKWKMRGGKWFQDQMIAGVTESDFLVFMVSRSSLKSGPVALEWKSKFAEKINNGRDTVFPFLIDDTPYDKLPDYLQNIYSYRYEGNPDNVIKLMDDVVFWKQEHRPS